MRNLITAILLGFLPLGLMAQYAIQSIPKALTNGANAVVWENNTFIQIESPSKLKEQHQRVVSVLNTDASQMGNIVLPYGPFNKFKDVKCILYNEAGIKVAEYPQKKFEDVNFLDNLTMAQDSRMLFLDLSTVRPPFTYELIYTEQVKGILDYPTYNPQFGFHTAVIKSSFEVQVPADMRLRYKLNHTTEPQISDFEADQKKFKAYRWSLNQLSAIPQETFGLSAEKLLPSVDLAPTQFNIDGYEGSFDTWDHFSVWQQKLLNDVPPLSETIISEVKARFGHLPERERIKQIYKYVQNTTRYISIQLGIGGWRPLAPDFVHEKKYGDCKALTWYTRALMRAVDIQACYTLVSAGDSPRHLDLAFPENVFNHVILTIPTATGDTIWLECTSQTSSFGYLGKFTGNRLAMILENGKAHAVRLGTDANHNIRHDRVKVLLNDANTATIKWGIHLSGLSIQELDFDHWVFSSIQDRSKWIEQYCAPTGIKVEHYEMSMDTTAEVIPQGEVSISASAAQFANLSAQRLFIQPNMYKPWKLALATDSTRHSAIFRRFGTTYVSEISIVLPAGWIPESLPKALKEDTIFGTYERDIIYQNGVLEYKRTIKLLEGEFAKERYPALNDFFKKMKKWDGENAVFVKK